MHWIQLRGAAKKGLGHHFWDQNSSTRNMKPTLKKRALFKLKMKGVSNGEKLNGRTNLSFQCSTTTIVEYHVDYISFDC